MRRRKTAAVAESCTGGLLGHLLTRPAGASDYFLGGVIAYSNEAKTALLGVPRAVLKKHGAVSAQTARSMAVGVRKKLKADVGVSITGIAGPSGGSREKPVGLVYIACADGRRVEVKRFLFKGSRAAVKEKAARSALRLLRRSPF